MEKLDHLLEKLVARGHRGMRLGLERTIAACRALGDPQRGLRCVHVAGTNGKGSVCAMVERIARTAGKRTGLYTSPHLIRFGERIRLDGVPVDDEAFGTALERVLRDAPEELTFFETLTLAAFVVFRDAAVDVAVLEVGLGGRLDATNVIEDPLATAVVSITRGQGGKWLEHADFLGDDVATIAREKAGIFKRGVPAVLGPLPDVARAAVLDVARSVGAAPMWELRPGPRVITGVAGDAWPHPVTLDPSSGLVVMPGGQRLELSPGLAGPHQLENAAVAAALAWAAGPNVASDPAIIARGIAETTWPGRLERFDVDGREVWLDCAHNVEGAEALDAALDGVLQNRNATLLFGALADKAWEPMIRLLGPRFSRRVYTSPPGRLATPPARLAEVLAGETIDAPAAALRRSIDVTPPGEVLVVAGSIYLVGQVRSVLQGQDSDPAMGL
jgi:dihydrofolate synthase / folylpolyglutamate synthase